MDIEFKTSKLERSFDHLRRKQMPFAMAQALTHTAQDAQTDTAKAMTGAMALKTSYLTRKGQLSITKARKSDGLHRMAATVGHKNWSMAEQMGEKTTIRRPNTSKYLYKPIGVKKTKTGKIPRALHPSRVFKKKNVFLSKTGNSEGIYQHYGPKRSKRRLLYIRIKSQTIRPAMSFNDGVKKTASRRLNKNFGRSMSRALRTAKH
ncbi:hypothetical protein [uncultured Kiloniella sp.]|uniref:hypothetical protein n=1 Tax=uncultured Kiloniella sp. TaxID=1133091 RepID=UPI00260377B6|nr:hypothetical protein [uncultured Kiloniella sp.]